MATVFTKSIFHDLLAKKPEEICTPLSALGGVSGSRFASSQNFEDLPIVIFDFETTGLDVRTCRIIEVGAVKYFKRKEVARLNVLINPGQKISPLITKITGITNDMIEGQPPVSSVLPKFHEFLRGSVGIAHNAEFDIGMLHYESQRLGITCDYTVYCTLKMARQFLKLERRNLDALAAHYKLDVGVRHRAVDDILLTAEILWRMLDENKELQRLEQFSSFRENML